MSKKDKAAKPKADKVPAGDDPSQARDERDDLLARLQRVSADYLNYQKRAQRDVADAREYANEGLIKSLLPVVDDMERALDAARENHGEDDPLFTGMQLVHDKALEVLGTFGVTGIEAVGADFDPEKHAAMMQQPSDEHPPQTVLQELQRGYQLKGRTIRPSSVIVSREGDADGEAPEGEETPR
jgi:molecular chaperone GrpE